jgi:class 3 adenylate cyclase/tetratricopeptide (TPR) repeat protein
LLSSSRRAGACARTSRHARGPLVIAMAQRISSPLFVGRAEELAAFERLIERAAGGGEGALMVAGEAGIGKSRLVAELEARARKAGALVLAGECVEVAEGELAFAPIVAALRPVMEDREAVASLEPPLRSALAALWPTLGEAGSTSREQLFEGVYRVLARLAERRLVVLIVEDLHWVDRSSRDLLGFLVRNARRDRLMLVATYRPDELQRGHPLRPFLAELERSGRAERLELEPLGRAELAEQLAAIGGVRPPRSIVDGIFARCEGNPFFAEELLATAETGGSDELPGSLREVLLLRVDRLAPTTQDVLRAAAVVGRSVDHRLLEDVSGVAESELLAALREAAEHHVLVLTARAMAYTFRHALLREAIYDDTFPAERLRLHRAIAQALSANPELASAGAAAELAYHWHAAGELPDALGASVRAAAEAERMHAYDECVGHIERALALWDRVEAPEEMAESTHVDLLLRGSQIADWAGDPERALMLAEQARTALDERVEPVRAAVAETRIGRALWTAGRGDDATEHLAEARRLVPARPPSTERADALAAEGRALMLTGKFGEARGRLEEALAIAASLGSPQVQASALNSLAIVYGRFGECDRAIASGREGLRIGAQFELAFETVRGYVNGSQAIDDAGRIREAVELGLSGIDAAHRLGMDRFGGDQLRMQAGWRLSRMGRFAEAERVIQPAMDAATTAFNVAGIQSISGRLAAERGAFDLAERLLHEAWALMQRSGGFQLIGPTVAGITSLHLWRGELEQADESVSDGLARAAAAEPDLMYNAELYWLAVRIQADLVAEQGAPGGDRGRRAEARARAVIADLEQAIRDTPGDGAPPEAIAFRDLTQAEFTRLRGEHDPAQWRAAGERFRALDARYKVAYADFRAAEALALAGARAAEIGEPLRAAHAVAVELEARPFQEQVETLARRTRVRLVEELRPVSGPGAEFGLTARELDVLRLLTDGRTNRQIGEELHIAAKTAGMHVSRILSKLRVANRGEAAAAADRLGLAENASTRADHQVDEVVELLTGSRRRPRSARLLATVMFTDIVGSTARAADLGDRRWRDLLDSHDAVVRAELSRFGGVAIKFIGDGTLATFDGPARAIDCACAIRDAVRTLGIEIRAGVHTGEIELRGADIGGIAVHIGARVSALARPSEILVSQTVTDLVAGSGIQFDERGAHELKGVPGTWQLHAVRRGSGRDAPSPA